MGLSEIFKGKAGIKSGLGNDEALYEAKAHLLQRFPGVGLSGGCTLKRTVVFPFRFY
jgi:hypothetical protein